MWGIDFEALLREWGYVAVFLGAMIEGETIILTASILAAAGYLSIMRVALIAFLGTLIADQGLFFVGYFYGDRVLSWLVTRFPQSQPYIERGFNFLKRFQTTYILIFRFIYGIRIISPVIIGSQKIPFRRFALLNLIAAVIWSAVSCILGYFLGELLLRYLHRYGLLVLLGIVIVGIGIWGLNKGGVFTAMKKFFQRRK